MKYKCEPCSYETVDKSNYNKHISSSKHIKILDMAQTNVQYISEVSDSEKICFYCSTKFTDMNALYRHVNKRCSEKKNLLNILTEKEEALRKLEENTTKIINEKNEAIKKLEEEKKKAIKKLEKDKKEALKKLEEEKNKIIRNLEEDKKKLEDHIEYFKHSNNTVNETTKKSVSALTYLAKKHKNSPPLRAMDIEGAKKVLEYKPNDDTLIEQLIYQYKNKTLSEYVGNIIVKTYKNENPMKQSIWSSDVARLTYIIKDIVGNSSEWTVDSKGVKLGKYIVKPIAALVYEMLPLYVQKHNMMIQRDMYDEDETDKKREFMNYSIDLQKYISNNKFEIGIVDFIAKHFRLNVNILEKLEYVSDYKIMNSKKI